MLWKSFSVYDAGARVFLRPFYTRSEQEAIRAVVEAGQDKQTPMGKYPSEFTLFGLGHFDDNTGVHENFPALNSYGPVSGLVEAATAAVDREVRS